MKGIPFKPDMIEAIKNRTKVMTRRAIKPCSTATLYDGSQPDWVYTEAKPRYQVGETVYIKEAYSTYGYPETPLYQDEKGLDIEAIAWHSPFFMPAWAARYFLKIKDVRAERVQEITEEDCYKEGCQRIYKDEALSWYRELWDSTNKPPYNWASNCWVWVYLFKLKEDK